MLITYIYSNEDFIKQIDEYNRRMSLGYNVLSIQRAPFNIINQLLHESFQERLANDLNFDCASFTDEEYEKLSSKGNVITIWDNDILVGTVFLGIQIRFSFIKCGFHEYLAVLLSSTAIPAISSVNWHKKNGFLPYKISSYDGRNYKSYNFIKPVRKNLLVKFLITITPLTLFVSKISKQ